MSEIGSVVLWSLKGVVMQDLKNICADSIVQMVEQLERETGAPHSKAAEKARAWCDRVLEWKPGQTKTCDECGGTGEVEDYSDGPNRVGFETCDVCDGKTILDVDYPRL